MKATKIVLFFLALLAGTLFSLKIIYRTSNSTPETKFKTVEINNQKLRVEIADIPNTITKGLSSRDQIGSDGMLFTFTKPSDQPFWMKDMRFPIDLLWINNNEITGIEENMPIPPTGTPDKALSIYSPPSAITAALELPAGSIEKLNIKIGDEIKY